MLKKFGELASVDDGTGGMSSATLVDGGDEERPLSKKVEKRLKRQQGRCERHESEKEQRRAEREERERLHAIASVDAGQDDSAQSEQRHAAKEERRRAQTERDQCFIARCRESFTIAIDCDYEDLMNDREVNSMCQQIMRAYGANRQASHPAMFCLAGRRPGGKVAGRLAAIAGVEAWVAVSTEDRGVTDLFDRDRLVYLTSESPHELVSMDASKVYIIGGIVDRNRHKGCSFEKANALGVATARLPIDSFLQRMASSKVLAINHVIEIILHFQASGCWEQALLSAVPSRKLDFQDAGVPACQGEATAGTATIGTL